MDEVEQKSTNPIKRLLLIIILIAVVIGIFGYIFLNYMLPKSKASYSSPFPTVQAKNSCYEKIYRKVVDTDGVKKKCTSLSTSGPTTTNLNVPWSYPTKPDANCVAYFNYCYFGKPLEGHTIDI